MNAQQIRGKSYSLPGAFDAMGRPYQQYQHNTTKLANPGHIDFSGYSMSVKNKPKNLSDMNPPPMAPVQQLSAKSRKKSKHNLSHEAERHVCAECGVVESPEWRKGPKGPKTLCNACGLRWAKRTRKEDTKKRR
jgi:ribosomal protein L37E